jgi:PAS domain S-box-containing protein
MPEAVHDQLLDSVPDGVFTVDSEWRITAFNRAAEQITGIGREEALGRRCCDVFRASICESACALKQTLATRRPVVNKVVYIVNASGQRLPISVSTAVLKDNQGRVIGRVESFRDLAWSRNCSGRRGPRIHSPTSSGAARPCGSCSTCCQWWQPATARC